MTSTSRSVDTDGVAAVLAGLPGWCLLRDGDVPAADAASGAADTTGSAEPVDVDVLVDPAHLDAFVARLLGAGFVERPAWGRGSHRFFFRFEPDAGTWLKVDVLSEVAFGAAQEFVTDLAPGVVARSRGAAGPAPADDLWVLLLHCLLDRQGRCGRHTARLGDLARAADPGHEAPAGNEARALVEGLLGAAGTEALLGRLRDPGFDGDLADVAGTLRSAWTAARRTSVLARRARALGARAASKPATALRRRGTAVAVVGPDGAGKSSVVAAVAATYPFPVATFYAGQYQGSVGPFAKLPGGHTLGLLVRQVVMSLRTVLHLARGRVVLFDRYAYDSRLSRPGASVKSRARRAVLGRVALRPQRVVVLDAPGEVLHARSQEHSPEILEDQRRRYAELAATRPGWLLVDASRPADAVRRDVTAQVWDAHHRRWRAP
ncbi:hypothetical protein [Kineosporia sp. A_224]|uniref:hypothetical protein n=1 Tax=Kineosporia sp. A_224 TaxID=1962180 RepID=UPI0013041BC1|nr:hypothetical protein [Kineosporia sp. A_224]